MQFDVVIGNPPYNRGIFLDFLDRGFEHCNRCLTMITPAKWQTCADDTITVSNISYREFRENNIKHISEVYFYPECSDVFNIYEASGITYLLMDKSEHDMCKVTNKCTMQKYFNSVEYRNIWHRESLINIGNEIVECMGKYESYSFEKYDLTKRYQVWTTSMLTGGCHLNVDGSCMYLGISRIYDSTNENIHDQILTCTCSYSSDIREECENFVSWLNTKFVRFFFAINLGKLSNIITDDNFRFVTDPGPFDHKFTDVELYEKYKLPQKYIDVIEAVIKSRGTSWFDGLMV